MEIKRYDKWERKQSAERIQRSGTRIAILALIICYVIAGVTACASLITCGETALGAIVFVAAHIFALLLAFGIIPIVTEVAQSLWDWLRGY